MSENETGDQAKALEEWLEEARALRAAADASEREFMLFLRAGEASGVWRPVAPTFDRFLKDHDVCEPARYRNACKALDVVPDETVRTIGMAAAVAALSAPDEKRPAVLAEMVAVAEKNGVPLSRQNADRIRHRYAPPSSRVIGEQTRVAKLEAELRKRDRRIRELEREVARLRKALGEHEAA